MLCPIRLLMNGLSHREDRVWSKRGRDEDGGHTKDSDISDARRRRPGEMRARAMNNRRKINVNADTSAEMLRWHLGCWVTCDGAFKLNV